MILEEILDEVDSRGRDIDPDNLVKRIVFAGHGLGQKIAGTRGSVRALASGAIRAHHARHYTGANLVLVVAGPVSYEEVVELAAPRLGALPRGQRAAAASAAPPGRTARRFRAVEHDDAQVEFSLAFPCRPGAAPRLPGRPRASGASSTTASPPACPSRWWSGTAWPTRSTPASTPSRTPASSPSTAPARPRSLERVAGEILRVRRGSGTAVLPAEELARVQQRHRMTLTFALDNPSELVGWFGAGELFGTDETLEERCRRVERVTAADVRRVARSMFQRRHLVAVAVGPGARSLRRALARAAERSPLA